MRERPKLEMARRALERGSKRADAFNLEGHNQSVLLPPHRFPDLTISLSQFRKRRGCAGVPYVSSRAACYIR